jgi:hypothetical protein
MAPVDHRAPVVPSLSDPSRTIYNIGHGRWYISVQVTTGVCAMTSGDYWFNIDPADAQRWIEHPELAP